MKKFVSNSSNTAESYIFPYDKARQHLIQVAARWLPMSCAKYAEKIVDLHLDPNNFAMPIRVNTLGLTRALSEGKTANQLREFLTLEKTETAQGIARVLVRTHLNRTGINFVSRGATEKTLSERVMGLFPEDENFELEELSTWTGLTQKWLAFANKSLEEENSEGNAKRLFEEDDLKSLRLLSNLNEENYRSCLQDKSIHNNWAKLLTGVYSGLKHLNDEYGHDPDRIWEAIDEASQTVDGVKDLIESTRKEVDQFGEALAGSFFADLGAAQFIKTDVHVVDSVVAFTGRSQHWAKQGGAFDLLHRSAKAHGVTPRAIDKLMYISCSSNLYLFDYANDDKDKFMKFLKEKGQESTA